jgi:hypothetical protein
VTSGDHGGLVEVGQQEEELVPTRAGNEVGLTGRVAQPLRELHEERVACLMAEGVVHQLEVVEIHRHDHHTEVVPLRTSERDTEELVEHRAIGEPGQPVVIREERDPFLGRFPVGDVQHDALDVLGSTVRIREDDRAVPEPDRPAVPSDQPVLEDEGVARLPASEVRGHRFVAVVRVQDVLPELWVLDVFLRAVSEDLLDLRAHVLRRHVLVGDVDVDDRRDLFHESPVLRLGLVKLRLGSDQFRDVEHQPEPVRGCPSSSGMRTASSRIQTVWPLGCTTRYSDLKGSPVRTDRSLSAVTLSRSSGCTVSAQA